MLTIRGIYEVAIRVRDLSKAERFYRGVLGLEVGLRDEQRSWVFLRAGCGLIVLQEDKSQWPTQHFAFMVAESDIESAAVILQDQGMPRRDSPTRCTINQLVRRRSAPRPRYPV